MDGYSYRLWAQVKNIYNYILFSWLFLKKTTSNDFVWCFYRKGTFFVRRKYQFDSKMKVIVSKCQHLEKTEKEDKCFPVVLNDSSLYSSH